MTSQNSAHEHLGGVPSLQWFEDLHAEQQTGFCDLGSQFESLHCEISSKVQVEAREPGEGSSKAKELNHATADSFPRPLKSSTALVRQPEFRMNEPSSEIIRVNTTIRIRRCPRFCKCQCHASSYTRTPRWLRSMVRKIRENIPLSSSLFGLDFLFSLFSFLGGCLELGFTTVVKSGISPREDLSVACLHKIRVYSSFVHTK